MRTLALSTLLIVSATLCPGQSLPAEPQHEAGNSVTGAFEGWFKNADGTFSFLLGYYNRNQKQEIDIPIGPNNRIDPGGPDQGQPTHFMPGRGWGVFVVNVPADFGDKKLTWTLVANGKTTVIPAYLHTDYEVSPFTEASVNNSPPVIAFDEKGLTSPLLTGQGQNNQGTAAQGPLNFTVERSAKLGVPLDLTIWAADDARFTSNSGARPKNLPPPVVLSWSKYRGPGTVTFSDMHPPVEPIDRKDIRADFVGKATTRVTFSEPGEYVLHLTANDYSGEGGGGFVCCWTNARVKVNVEK